MKQSTARILTTHKGSLPRPHNLLTLMIEEQAQPGTERTANFSIRATRCAGVGGRPSRFPRVFAAVIPVLTRSETRSEINADSNSATVQ
jgi:hypothetical protein